MQSATSWRKRPTASARNSSFGQSSSNSSSKKRPQYPRKSGVGWAGLRRRALAALVRRRHGWRLQGALRLARGARQADSLRGAGTVRAASQPTERVLARPPSHSTTPLRIYLTIRHFVEGIAAGRDRQVIETSWPVGGRTSQRQRATAGRSRTTRHPPDVQHSATPSEWFSRCVNC